MSKTLPKTTAPIEVTHVSDATLRNFVGYHMKRASNVFYADLAKTLKPFKLRMLTYTALVLVVDNPGMRQRQLADAMEIERPNMVVLIDELEKLGLIIRETLTTDRRAYALRATSTGEQVYEAAVAAVITHENEMLEGVDSEMRETLITAMNLIKKSKD